MPVRPFTIRSVAWKKSSKKKEKKKEKKKDDLYALLGLKNERWMATPKMLKDCEST